VQQKKYLPVTRLVIYIRSVNTPFWVFVPMAILVRNLLNRGAFSRSIACYGEGEPAKRGPGEARLWVILDVSTPNACGFKVAIISLPATQPLNEQVFQFSSFFNRANQTQHFTTFRNKTQQNATKRNIFCRLGSIISARKTSGEEYGSQGALPPDEAQQQPSSTYTDKIDIYRHV